MADKTIAFTVDEEFHKEIKMRTAETGQFLKGYIISLIKDDLKNAKAKKRADQKEFSIEDALKKEKELRDILNQLAKNEKK